MMRHSLAMEGGNETDHATVLLLASALLGTSIAAACAQSNWAQNHPRREQVNDRLANQNRRINQEVREGEITKGQAKQLHQEDHAIRQEERGMAKAQWRPHHTGGAEGTQSAGKRR